MSITPDIATRKNAVDNGLDAGLLVRPDPANTDMQRTARTILDHATDRTFGGLDTGLAAARVAELSRTDPAGASEVNAAVECQLGLGDLSRFSESMRRLTATPANIGDSAQSVVANLQPAKLGGAPQRLIASAASPGGNSQLAQSGAVVTGSEGASKPMGPTLRTDGDVRYYTFQGGAEIFPVVRSRTENFTATATTALRNNNLDLVVNGAPFEFPREWISGSTYARATLGPVNPSETQTIGILSRFDGVVAGRSSPQTFYMSKVTLPDGSTTFQFGQGDASRHNSIASIGGGIPLVINGQRYGASNEYVSTTPDRINAPATGEAGRYQPYLTQRSNAGYRSFVTEYEPGGNTSTGKVILAFDRETGNNVVVVQRDGASSGRSLNTIRDTLIRQGYESAIMLDGSSSATAVTTSGVEVAPAGYKDNTIGSGIGFRMPGR